MQISISPLDLTNSNFEFVSLCSRLKSEGDSWAGLEILNLESGHRTLSYDCFIGSTRLQMVPEIHCCYQKKHLVNGIDRRNSFIKSYTIAVQSKVFFPFLSVYRSVGSVVHCYCCHFICFLQLLSLLSSLVEKFKSIIGPFG